MSGRFYEDYKAGDKFTTPGRTISKVEIVNFSTLTGADNPLFLDEEFAKRSLYKSIIAPGLLTLAVAQGLWHRAGLHKNMLGLLGINNTRFYVAVKEGDTITVEIEIIELRETRRHDRGVLTSRHTVKNQADEKVAEYEATFLIKRRVEEED